MNKTKLYGKSAYSVEAVTGCPKSNRWNVPHKMKNRDSFRQTKIIRDQKSKLKT